jgi:lipoate-protein ligase A
MSSAASIRSDAVLVLPGRVDPAVQLAQESSLLQAAAAAPDTPARAILWRGTQSLICSPLDQRLPDYPQACARLALSGWPVAPRPTGGSTVPLMEGVVNLTLILPWRGAPPGLKHAYEVLCAPLLATLAAMGLAASTGPVPQAICDGQFNIRIGSRKLIGTAQRQSARGNGGAVLLHAGILVEVDVAQATRVVREFYALAKGTADYTPDALVSLSQCLASPPTQLTEHFTTLLARQLTQQPPRL